MIYAVLLILTLKLTGVNNPKDIKLTITMGYCPEFCTLPYITYHMQKQAISFIRIAVFSYGGFAVSYTLCD